MNFLFRPLWLFIAVTVPHLFLLGAGAVAYQIIEPQLTEPGVRAWALAGAVLALLAAGFTLLAVFSARKSRPLPTRLGPALLLTYLPCVAAAALKMDELVPAGIPRWMLLHGDPLVLVFTLLMPALIYGLFLTVAWLTPDEASQSAWKSFAFAVAIPLCWYLVGTGGQATWQSRTLASLLPYLLILSAVAFLFFLVRTAYIAMTRQMGRFRRFRALWIALVSLVFPQLGLALHSGRLLDSSLPEGPFGDFSHPAFYLLAAVNGVLLCSPAPRGTAARWSLACGRALLLPFTVYFFLVFLPYFPLSVVAVFFCGLGLLMLTPLLLMMVHAAALREDFAHLRSTAGGARSAATLFAAALLLPALVVAGCLQDRVVLHRALDYVHAPDYSTPEDAPLEAAAIGRVLSHVRAQKAERGQDFLNDRLPYLSPLYQRIVLGNLKLADRTIRELETIFFGSSAIPVPVPSFAASNPREIALSRISASSVPIDAGRALRSTVELEITNSTGQIREFATSFALPEGAWIGGFHLWIGDRREPGILAESRAAAWVYRQIVSMRRDPGILYRQEDGRIGLRVFPFAAREARRTGFEIVHREPVLLRIDGKEVLLGEGHQAPGTAAVVQVGGGEIHYVPTALKRTLPTVRRTPVLHVVIDCSVAAAPQRAEFIQRVNRFLAEDRFGTSTVRFTLADSGATTFDRDARWERRVREHESAGGFFLGRSVKTLLRQHFEERGTTYPILVVVTDAMENALVPGGLSAFSFTAPEFAALRHLGPSGKLTTYRFSDLSTPVAESQTPSRAVPVLAYPSRERPLAYLPDDGSASVVIAGADFFDRETEVGTSPWESALALEGLWRALQLDPVERRRRELGIIRMSFAAGIMTPATTYIALENEAQKQALLAKQRQTLGADIALDVDEASFEQMPEPGWLPLLGLLLGLYALSRVSSGANRFNSARSSLVRLPGP